MAIRISAIVIISSLSRFPITPLNYGLYNLRQIDRIELPISHREFTFNSEIYHVASPGCGLLSIQRVRITMIMANFSIFMEARVIKDLMGNRSRRCSSCYEINVSWRMNLSVIKCTEFHRFRQTDGTRNRHRQERKTVTRRISRQYQADVHSLYTPVMQHICIIKAYYHVNYTQCISCRAVLIKILRANFLRNSERFLITELRRACEQLRYS